MTTQDPLFHVEQPKETPTVRVGDRLRWIDIHYDGSEQFQAGIVWSNAPALPRVGKTWFVQPIDAVDQPHGVVVRVALAGRRHRCGTESLNGRWVQQGGRYIDKGEFYRETDPRSHFDIKELLGLRPISSKPKTAGAQNDLAAYLAVIEKIAREQGTWTE